MDAAAARRLHSKLALALVTGLAGFALAGCESSLSLFGSNSVASAPEPAAPPKPQPAQAAIAKVSVAPIIGAPDAVAKQMHQEFVGAIERQRVAVAVAKDERADYTLRGYIVAAKDKTATKVSYIWDVTDPTGKRVNRITGEEVVAGAPSKDPWAALTPQVAQSLAAKAANSFVAWLPSQVGTGPMAAGAVAPNGIGAQTAEPGKARATRTAAAAPASATDAPTTGSIGRDGPVTAIIPVVRGAPGDGSRSLTAAIQQELSSKGVALGDKPTASSYRVEGTVTIGQASEGKQPIQIEWLVRDPQGKKLGTVSQKNEIPEGSLDGAWGKTAEQAAGAAAQGIIKLLPQQRAVN